MLNYNKKLFLFLEYLIQNANSNKLDEKLFYSLSYKLFNSAIYFETLLLKQNIYLEISKYLDLQFYNNIINNDNILGKLHISDKIKELIFQRINILKEINFLIINTNNNDEELNESQLVKNYNNTKLAASNNPSQFITTNDVIQSIANNNPTQLEMTNNSTIPDNSIQSETTDDSTQPEMTNNSTIADNSIQSETTDDSTQSIDENNLLHKKVDNNIHVSNNNPIYINTEHTKENIEQTQKDDKNLQNININKIEILTAIKNIYIFSKDYSFLKHNVNLLKASWNTADTIWKLMKDNSTDINFYTKRTSVAIIYNLVLKKYLFNKNYQEEAKIKEYISSLIDSYINFVKKFK
ncbi:MAG: hypothetical protein U1E31_02075 [Rickettsiales bacterium]